MKSERVASPLILFFFFIVFLLALTEIVCSISVIPAEVRIKRGESGKIMVHNNAPDKAEYSINFPPCLSVTPQKFKLNPRKTKRVEITSHCSNITTIAISEEVNSQTFKSTLILKIKTAKAESPAAHSREKDAEKEKTAVSNPNLPLLITAAATSIASAILLKNSAIKSKEKS